MERKTKPGMASAKDQALTVRFPPGLLPKLDAAAERNGRSRNSEIVQRLTDSLNLERRGKSR